MQSQTSTTALVELAFEQWGLVTSRQARAATAVTPQQLKRLTDSGVLERLHHGIYRLARLPHDEHLHKRLAWIALDPEHLAWERLDEQVPTGVLSHRTAAEMHHLGDLDADAVELTAPRRIRLSLSDVAIHRGSLGREDWQIVDGLPVTTPIRTIADLAAAGVDAGHLAGVVRDALVRDLTTIDQATAALAPHAFAYGHRALDGDGFITALIDSAGVPAIALTLTDIARRHTSVAAPLIPSTLSAELARAVGANLMGPHIAQIAAEIARIPALDNILESAGVREALGSAFADASSMNDFVRIARELPTSGSFKDAAKAAQAVLADSPPRR